MQYKNIVSLRRLLAQLGEKKLPRKFTVAIARNMSILDPIIKVINDQNIEIAKKYCKLNDDGEVAVRNDNGNQIIDFNSPEDGQAYIKELSELESTEEDVNLIKVSASVLDALDEDRFDSITANEELQLACMIDYEN